MNVGIVFLAFFATLLIGTPIGVGVGLTCLTASASNPTMPATADFIFRNMVTALDTYSLLAVPLFILSGVIMARGGISKKLLTFLPFYRQKNSRTSYCSCGYLSVLRLQSPGQAPLL